MSSLRYVLSAFLAIGCLSANAVTLPSLAKESAATQNQAQFDDFRGDHSIVIFVSATDGNDHWSGHLPWPNFDRMDGPLATLDHAREVVQSIDKTRTDRVTVFFRGGTYYVPKTVTFREADSGTTHTEIVYANFPGESPVFTGGVRVENWMNQGGNKWTTTLPAKTQLFENLFYSGGRRLRPRLGGYLGQVYYIDKPVRLDAGDPKINDNCRIAVAWFCRFQSQRSGTKVSGFRSAASCADVHDHAVQSADRFLGRFASQKREYGRITICSREF